MRNRWTKADERDFQRLLQRRRKATLAVLNTVNPSHYAIEEYSNTITEDYDASNAWEDFLNWEHPDVVRDEMIEMKEFFDGGDDVDEPARPHKKG